MPPAPPQFFDALNSDYGCAFRAEEAARDTIEKFKTNRPINTTKSYKRSQQEFLRWCHDFCPPGPLNEVVDDKKLHLFLLTQVPYILLTYQC